MAQAAPSVQTEVAFPHLRFDQPLFLTHPPDGKDQIFVVEQKGRVFWFPNQTNVKNPTLFLDIQDKVRTSHTEEGLLGFAFHPDYKTHPYVFVCYSASRPRRNVVSRFLVDWATLNVDRQSEKILMEVNQPYGNHNGGMIAFNRKDGFLYISLGDGGSAGDPKGFAQNRNSLLGKLLRIDVDNQDPGLAYAIPKDNPFVNDPTTRSEIWALGLRNVWRFSFDRETHTLWAGDVGQTAREEINIIEKGKNYGWNYREGKIRYPRGPKAPAGLILTDPIIDHKRDVSRSITGGYVYRGKKNTSLRGKYIYGDFITGIIWALGKGQMAQGTYISSFGEDQAGEIYFTSFDGRIYVLEESKIENR